MNFDYRYAKLCPAATAPGFFSHQSDMTNITGARAWDNNRFIRDFDYFGYPYALLSSVGSAGLNNVMYVYTREHHVVVACVRVLEGCLLRLFCFCLHPVPSHLVNAAAHNDTHAYAHERTHGMHGTETPCRRGMQTSSTVFLQQTSRLLRGGLHGPTTTLTCS